MPDDDIGKLWEQIFMPPSQERIDHLVSLAEDVEDIANRFSEDAEISGTLELAANQILILSSMTVAGYALYHEHWEASKKLYEEAKFNQMVVGSHDRDLVEALSTDAMLHYERLRETDPEEILQNSEWPDA